MLERLAELAMTIDTGSIREGRIPCDDEAVFVPKAIVAAAIDQATGENVSFQVSLASVPVAGRAVVDFGTATLYADLHDGKAYQDQLISIIGIPLVAAAQVANGLIVAAGNVVASCAIAVWDFVGWVVESAVSATTAAVVAAVDNTVNGFRFVVQKTRDFSDAAAVHLDLTMRVGKVFLDDAGHIVLVKLTEGGEIVLVLAERVGEGILVVVDAATFPVMDARAIEDQLINNVGYEYFCGEFVRSPTSNPFDELDTSCFIHDFCLDDRLDKGAAPFSRGAQAIACNAQLVQNAVDSNCFEGSGSLIDIEIPPISPERFDPTILRYQLPDHNGKPPIYVADRSSLSGGSFTIGACLSNQSAIQHLFSIGIMWARRPVVLL